MGAHEQATEIQHILICLEMVFFAIAHLCVFPAEEWEPNYRPKDEPTTMPSMGISDFTRDVKYIAKSVGQSRRMKKGSREDLLKSSSSHDENDIDDDENNNNHHQDHLFE